VTVQAIESKIADLHLSGRKISADISGAIVGQVPVKRTISGASSIVVPLEDPHLKLTRKPFAQQATGLTVDGLAFRMVGVKHAGGTTTLTFEDAAVAALRRRKGPKKASRDKVTRAQFIGRLAKEAGVPFISPEKSKVQPIEDRKPKAKRKAEKNERREHGFDAGANVKVKGVRANQSQLRIAEEILDEGVRLGASFRVLSMAIACATQESNMVNLTSGDAAHPDSAGPFGQWLVPYPKARESVTQCARYFYLGIPGHTGIIQVVKENPDMNFSLAIQAVQQSAFPDAYQQWKEEANNTVREYLGGQGTTSYSVEVEKPYSFEVKKDENYWEAIQRLAKEVNWRAFVTAGKLYYFTDQRLLASRPRMRITSDHANEGTVNYPPGIDSVDYEVHMGKKVQSATVKGRAKTWAAPPGSAVILEDDFGAAAGRWLVAEITTSLSNPDVSIKLKRPSKPLPEPAPETSTKTVDVPGGGSARGTGIDGVTIRSTAAGAPHWGGSYDVFRQFINPFMTNRGLPQPSSTKRPYNTGSGTSDHYVGSPLAYAADYPTGSGEDDARALAKAMGAVYSPGSWNQCTITVDGHRFACQILWAAPDGTHYDHVHVGLHRL
jgi:hypothetical protein